MKCWENWNRWNLDKKVIVVIPHYNNFDLLHARLWELYKHEKDNINYVLVVDNGSTEESTKGGLRWWADFKIKTNFDVRVIRTEENIGFLKASNLGLQYPEISSDDVVILLSNDVIIRGKFIEQIIDSVSNVKSLVGGILYTQDTGWNTFESKTYPYLEGWLLATSLQNWIELDFFDELYAPHIFEDIDLSTTALSKGYELIPLNNPNLHHMAGQSIKYTPERDELTKVNQKKFFEKWNKNEK